jgi:carboxypeptidase Taq
VDERYERLRERLAEIWDVSKAASILGWDQQTKMPAKGAAGRAEQLATLGR